MNYLPTNITFLRNKADLSQSQIALRVNKRQTAISSWEKNQSSPSIEDLEKLTEIFGISASELLFTDLSTVQLSDSANPKKSSEDVQGNVQTSVQLNRKNKDNLTDIDSLKSQLNDKKETIEALKGALSAKGDLIDSLNNTISMLSEENERLKREVSGLQAQIDGHSGRGGQKKSA